MKKIILLLSLFSSICAFSSTEVVFNYVVDTYGVEDVEVVYAGSSENEKRYAFNWVEVVVTEDFDGVLGEVFETRLHCYGVVSYNTETAEIKDIESVICN